MTQKMRIGIIGFGAMAQSLVQQLSKRDAIHIADCLIRSTSTRPVPGGIVRHDDISGLIAAAPDLVVECAGHRSVADHVPRLLRAGIDVTIVSIGALADAAIREELQRAAEEGGARLVAVAGAIGGLDALRAAALAGLDAVTYTGRKPPGAWTGTPAEEVVALDTLREPATFYEGSAAEAARDYPKNANVTAAVALAGIGFDRTRVRLIADPTTRTNSHQLEVQGAFGRFAITIENNPLPENPKTSWLAALSVAEAVIRRAGKLEL
ncbi:aspartate dehydrogenase [Paracoccus sp. TK19116]|uniref:L-aspartate dehydrogenase n=1 Tax=Paracoccus albicereus TaxID=2922394 RepID=A0ABT1MNY3_9RHOB|nr:aspartate dehydrogenase [Paracoccus albicereus]MCQ0969896.1 aspartate dehydrogenase [Paracoccus albicereus]